MKIIKCLLPDLHNSYIYKNEFNLKNAHRNNEYSLNGHFNPVPHMDSHIIFMSNGITLLKSLKGWMKNKKNWVIKFCCGNFWPKGQKYMTAKQKKKEKHYAFLGDLAPFKGDHL
ncbi:unnamed protein product [Meganyctiphanes norvegica]|uniref:Uncharacterized protein n=1 Tax=Meganyctiphanes norvegica TaxID=48144 RepID=A0AAV2QS25_MEGNR